MQIHNPQGVILEEIAVGCSQKSVALTYSYIIRQELDTADWLRINRAIVERWPSPGALMRVKKMAWRFVEGKQENT